jgi:hypothetical protein
MAAAGAHSSQFHWQVSQKLIGTRSARIVLSIRRLIVQRTVANRKGVVGARSPDHRVFRKDRGLYTENICTVAVAYRLLKLIIMFKRGIVYAIFAAATLHRLITPLMGEWITVEGFKSARMGQYCAKHHYYFPKSMYGMVHICNTHAGTKRPTKRILY